MSGSPDSIDLADLARSLRRGWRTILGSLLASAVVTLLVIYYGPRMFSSSASVVVRSSGDVSGSLLARATGEVGGGAGGGGMGTGAVAGGVSALLGGGGSGLETEIQILQSESVLGAAIDSLRLQVVPRSPTGLPGTFFVSDARLPVAFEKFDLKFERTSPGRFHVHGDGVDTTVAAGGTLRLPQGTLALREALPPRFTLRVLDYEDALREVSKNFTVKKAGGDVIKASYRASDSVTAAAVPNIALSEYLRRKRTSDRGVNAHRAEFLQLQIDSIDNQLRIAEGNLRRFQERSGLLDPEIVGKIDLEQLALLRKSQGETEVEAGALDLLLEQIGAGRMTARQLVGFPAFLKSPGINSLLQQLSTLETERTRLLERRTEQDPEVLALSKSIADVEGQLLPLARSYQASLRRQKQQIATQLGVMTARLDAFPGNAEEGGRMVREVKRLSGTQTALRTQLVQAQLNTVAEGGDVRGLDVARVPRRVFFPDPAITASVGLGAGLIVGILLALVGGSHGRYFQDQYAIERSLGVPALRFDPRTPLLMAGRAAVRTVLLIPMEFGVETGRVAERLADTALARGETATILDLTGPSSPVRAGASVGGLIARMELEHGLVVVRLPGLSADSTAAALTDSRVVLLVAPARRVNRRELVGALDTLRRLEIPCAGVVMSDGDAHAALPG